MTDILFTDREARIAATVASLLAVDSGKVTRTATFEGLGADSLDHIEIVLALEDDFDIEISDGEAEKVKTLDDAFKLVSGKLD